MAVLLKGFVESVNYLMHSDFTDPRTRHWFGTGSILPPLLLFISYYCFVKSWGPQFMKNRPAFKIDKLLIVYNIVQILFSIYIVYRGIRLCYVNGNYSWVCQPVSKSTSDQAMEEAWTVRLYYLAKVTDLLDTVFFIVRKKMKQASFLHVYHHMGMILTGVIGTRYVPGGHAISLGLVNSTVHAVMYTYYLLSALDSSYTQSKWKKYITQMQMIQFLCLVVHFSLPIIFPCGYPLWPCAVIVPQYLFMLALFNDFYQNSYNKPKVQEKVQ